MERTFIDSQNFTWSCKKQQMTIKAGKTLISWFYFAIGFFFLALEINKSFLILTKQNLSHSFFVYLWTLTSL